MKFLCLTLGLAALAIAPAPAKPDLGLGDNESLVYHVSWAILPGVGAIRVDAKATSDPTGRPFLRVTTQTATRGLARILLPFDGEAESLFDRAKERLVWMGESTTMRDQHKAHTVTFDYRRGQATYVDGADPAHPRILAMPPGYPTDLITCLLYARTWNLRPGQARDALVLFEDEFYQLTIHAIGYESIVTPLGEFNTLILEPRMEKTPPLGMFRRGSTVRVWIAQDPRRLPVRFRVQFKFGTGVAMLAEYHPPTAAQ
jgi:hypothetical protein